MQERNVPAEDELRRKAWLRSVIVRDGLPIPPGPNSALAVPVVGSDPATSRAITRLLQQLSPVGTGLSSVMSTLPANRSLIAQENGIAQDRMPLEGSFNFDSRRLYLNPNRDPQNQYETLLHELFHSVGGSESETQKFEQRHRIPPPNGWRPAASFPAPKVKSGQ